MTRISIYDTTLRDGSQGEGVDFSLQDKLLITRRFDELGIDYIEGGYPLSNPKDSAFFNEIRKETLRHAKVCAFGMTRRRGITADQDVGMKSLIESEAPVVTIVGKTWDMHVTDVLRVDLEENLAMIRDSVAYCRSQGREVFYDAEHFFDGLKNNREYALKTIRAAEEAGANVIIACDTNGGSLPEWIAEAMDLARSSVSAPLGIHCHNDSDLATANSLAAVEHGATQIQGTINGIGERCGNTDLCAVVANLGLKMPGFEVLEPESLGKLTEVSRFVYESANMNFRTGQPFVGASAFAHKGGMHVHAMARAANSYEHIEPSLVGNERRFLISELSGQSNVLAFEGGKFELTREQAVKVLNRVQELEHEGYQFEASEASFDLLIRRELGEYKPFFNRISYRVNSETDCHQDEPITEATLKIRVHDQIEHVVAEGDGPVNALDAAIRKALEPSYPILKEMKLVDYKVRVVNARAGTAARVRVTIESSDSHDVWGTVGVHENIIEASWRALVDSVEYKLSKEQQTPVGAEAVSS
ncbi:2-isopropylmalate synthase [Planctomycetes bacterium Pan216]|uniref:Citramalate synthase n=1 Tax=Kolteria novifilia TaxID=2527975 RepID=A0A518B9D8_9BACT|nr:2-isopropylmalate synthase [Planctomycetes bacterium Pan216]